MKKFRKTSRPTAKAAVPPLTRLPPLDVQQRYSVVESLAYLRTSRKSFYALIARGRLVVIKEGRRAYVPGSEIARLSAAPASAP